MGKGILGFLSAISMFLILSSLVSAFAVSSPFWDESPLEMDAGETANVVLLIQNMGSEDEINVNVGIDHGEEVAEMADGNNIYAVPGGEKKEVIVKITTPDDAKPGDRYDVGFRFTSGAEGGGFGLGTSIVKEFDVVIKEEKKGKPGTEGFEIPLWAIIIGIILVLIIIIVIILKRRNTAQILNKKRIPSSKFK